MPNPVARPAGAVWNFGRNVVSRPANRYRPASEREVLEILERHREGTIRALGAGHAWSPGIETDDVLVDLGAFDGIHIDREGPDRQPTVRAGAGAPIKKILAHLRRHGLTLPSLGLITEQTIAGATATGTHGSGRHSLSHYVRSLEVACYDDSGTPGIRTLDEGMELEAGRCSLGCVGLVLEVTLETVPLYFIEEQSRWAEDIGTVLSWEADTPLQQFYLIPESWRYLAQRRRVAPGPRRGGALLYRLYWLTLIDVSLHVVLKLFASVLRSPSLIRLLYRRILPALVFPGWPVVDVSDRQLVMEHELFRHLELELFVRRRHVDDAAALVEAVLHTVGDPDREAETGLLAHLSAADLTEQWSALRGSYLHHYPICFRRVQPDDTLISMSSWAGTDREDWYAISLITYQTPRGPFQAVAALLATLMERRFGARIHWGKWFPHTGAQVERLYPALDDFRRVCRRLDPHGVFRNDFVRDRLFGGRGVS